MDCPCIRENEEAGNDKKEAAFSIRCMEERLLLRRMRTYVSKSEESSASLQVRLQKTNQANKKVWMGWILKKDDSEMYLPIEHFLVYLV